MFDSDTGLQNNLHRWYDPHAGRSISEDPIGFAAGDANLYRYVGNEVTGARDPTGLEEKRDTGPVRGERLEELVSQKIEMLNGVIAKWRNQGYDFAADLLAEFLGRRDNGSRNDTMDFSKYWDKAKNILNYRLAKSRLIYREVKNRVDNHKFGTHPLEDIKIGDIARQGDFDFYLGELFWAMLGTRVGFQDATLSVICVNETSFE